MKTPTYSQREPNFRQIALSSFIESQEELEPSLISNGKLSQKDEILFILSIIEDRILTKNELYEIVQFVERILGTESMDVPQMPILHSYFAELTYMRILRRNQISKGNMDIL